MRRVLLLHGVQSSHLTWWRAEADLRELGWEVLAPDLPGHGDARAGSSGPRSVEEMADAVADRTASFDADLVVGHSLGAVIALAMAARPGARGALVVEDPPGLLSGPAPGEVADVVERWVREARDAPEAVERNLLVENPAWAPLDARAAVAGRQALDLEQVTGFLRAATWDLAHLVAACTVPVALIAATEPGTALTGLDRAALLEHLPAERVRVVRSGHAVHRDRPALWLQAVVEFAGSLAP